MGGTTSCVPCTRLRVHTNRCTHTVTTTLRCTPIAYRAPHACSEPRRRQSVLVGPVAGLCGFRVPFWFGRPRKPWPTCQCAWRCACTAPTKLSHTTTGHAFGYSSGTKQEVCHYRGARSAECTAARVRVRKMPRGVVAGVRAARDGAARAKSAADADGRCRCAARESRGGAGLAAVGAARDGVRGDHAAQGASRGLLAHVRVGCTGHGRGPTRSRRVRGQWQCSRLESGRALSTSGTASSSRTHFRFPIWTRE
jgi:hypothetical protein